jgi:hypothetical protein
MPSDTSRGDEELGGRAPHVMLGVAKDASPAQVTQAFRRKVLQGGHPDTGGDDQTFRELARARDVLLRQRHSAAKTPTGAPSGPPPQRA